VGVARVISGAALKSCDLSRGDFVEAVYGDGMIFRYVVELRIGTQDRKLLHRKEQDFGEGDVHLDRVLSAGAFSASADVFSLRRMLFFTEFLFAL
jgi:hypothetical protein